MESIFFAGLPKMLKSSTFAFTHGVGKYLALVFHTEVLYLVSFIPFFFLGPFTHSYYPVCFLSRVTEKRVID